MKPFPKLSPRTLADVLICLEYLIQHEEDDFEEQCRDRDLDPEKVLKNPKLLSHVYPYAIRAMKELQ